MTHFCGEQIHTLSNENKAREFLRGGRSPYKVQMVSHIALHPFETHLTGSVSWIFIVYDVGILKDQTFN